MIKALKIMQQDSRDRESLDWAGKAAENSVGVSQSCMEQGRTFKGSAGQGPW